VGRQEARSVPAAGVLLPLAVFDNKCPGRVSGHRAVLGRGVPCDTRDTMWRRAHGLSFRREWSRRCGYRPDVSCVVSRGSAIPNGRSDFHLGSTGGISSIYVKRFVKRVRTLRPYRADHHRADPL